MAEVNILRSTGWIDGTAILVAVVIVVLVTSINDYNKEQKFRKLNEVREEKSVTVIRNGEKSSISVYDILVGDVVELEAGATIPADGLYVSGQSILMVLYYSTFCFDFNRLLCG